MRAPEALAELMAGNARYLAGNCLHPNQSQEHRENLLEGQQPLANVLCCSDSRVSPSILFDQGLGDLFVMRVAGNGVENGILASLEFATEVLRVPLTLVLAHSQCGAVQAALAEPNAAHPLQASPHLQQLLEPIRDSAQHLPHGDVNAVAKAHALASAQRIRSAEPILSARCQRAEHTVLAGFYDIATGAVELLEPAPGLAAR